jgi:Rrf2 family nitric oxide-sensitive transcriptional repressor
MRLTDYTDYSLRTLMYLGLNREGLVTIQEIAEVYGISKNHLMKVVHQLGVAGVVDTVRGRNGGLRLKKEPEDINLGQVVRGTEPDFTMVECFDRKSDACILSPSCELKSVLHRATSAYFEVLDGVTLAQLLKNHGSLRKLTEIQIHPARRKY